MQMRLQFKQIFCYSHSFTWWHNDDVCWWCTMGDMQNSRSHKATIIYVYLYTKHIHARLYTQYSIFHLQYLWDNNLRIKTLYTSKDASLPYIQTIYSSNKQSNNNSTFTTQATIITWVLYYYLYNIVTIWSAGIRHHTLYTPTLYTYTSAIYTILR